MNYSLESEQSVLGSILLKAKMFTVVNLILTVNDFYDPRHKTIYHAICELFKQGKDIDYLTVSEELIKNGKSEVVGGANYISDLSGCVATANHAKTYAITVRDYAIEREYDLTMTLKDTMENTIKKLDLLYRRKTDTTQHKTEMIHENTKERLEARFQKGLVKPMKTSHEHLNTILGGGFRKGCYYMFSGVTGSGKTRLATDCVVDLVENKNSVLYVSLELALSSIEAMYVAKKFNVSYNKFNDGTLERGLMEDIYTDLERQQENFAIMHHVNRSKPLHPNEIDVLVEERLKCVGSIDVLIVDYITELKLPGYDNTPFGLSKMYGEISKRMNDIAVKYDVCVIGLVQTQVPKRGEEGFQIGDIGKSKEMMEPAWFVAGLVRDKTPNGLGIHPVKNRFHDPTDKIDGSMDWYYNTYKELSSSEFKEEETKEEKLEHPF